MTPPPAPRPLCDAALFVSCLTLHNFRNYVSVRLPTYDTSVIITGDNGTGKTNILEALSLLIPGRGIRGAKVDMFANRTQPTPVWGVSASCETFVGNSTIGTGYDAQNPNRRMVKINTQKCSQNQLGAYMSCIWLTPQMDKLFLESPSHRRRFLDRLILGFDPAHAARVQEYEKAMRNRSKVLKTPNPDPVWLNALEKDIARRAVAIAAARNLITDRLNHLIKDGYNSFPGAKITINGSIENMLTTQNALDTEHYMCQQLCTNRPHDGIYGGASIGVHKTDIQVHHMHKNIDASLCSTGEQKALLIAIILGNLRLHQAETGHVPVLLLDEIAAHLDTLRLHALFDALATLKPQIWYTGINSHAFAPIINHCTHIKTNKINVL